ncbi:hypothetical protein BN946_scf185038.g2 [Trametes cinnabarina]|uniref:Retrotransposon gag domain-containing protein n=1 Tax=Pycnoporus cinnabarinus TaxID=5643 RepID=A0A060S5R9_PYCCI|nr:hypothetical protein BN946_scf185038.g2 [Trametes cinnabarina]
MTTPGPDDTFQGFSAQRITVRTSVPETPVNPATGVVDPRFTQTVSPLHFSPDSEAPAQGGQAGTTTPVPRPPSPGNPFAPPENPPPPPPPAPGPVADIAPMLAMAIDRFASMLQQAITPPQSGASEQHNVREPDQLDRSDPNKLRLFFAQLELVFKAHPRTFSSDEKKVTYAISFLKGTALQWFEPYLLEGATDNPPLFISSYEAFQDELRTNFGPYDTSGAAEHELMNLRMTENQRIAKYITQFTRLATQVRWGNAPLRYRFYDGLPNRLKDRISEVGKPTTLNALRDLAQSIDNRYWERKAEQARESGTSKSGHKSSSDSKSGSSSQSGHASNTTANTPAATPSKSGSGGGTPKTPGKTPAKPYADKLGKDGKLTPKERQRRFANNLCLFCGGAGHTAGACPKKTSSASKARAAQATPAAPAPTLADAPKEPKN